MLSKPQRQTAEVLRIALCCSCCQREDIIDWADRIIEINSDPDYYFIEISTSGSSHILDLINNLKKMSIGSNHYSALRTVLGRMYEIASKEKQKLAIFASGLYQIAIENQYDLPNDLLFCNGVEDEYSLAHSGIYGNLADVEKDFINSLKIHWHKNSSTDNWYAEQPHTSSDQAQN
jgi:hypothetical protein